MDGQLGKASPEPWALGYLFSMPEERRLQVYETDLVRVTFDPNVCRHSGVCLRALPAVFDVQRKRWIQPEAAEPAAVMAAAARCPSGALQSHLVTTVMRSARRPDDPA